MLDSLWLIIAHSSINLVEENQFGSTNDKTISFSRDWSCQHKAPDRHGASGKEWCGACLQCGAGCTYIIYDKNFTFKKRASCKCRTANKSTRNVLATIPELQVYLSHCCALADQQFSMQRNAQC